MTEQFAPTATAAAPETEVTVTLADFFALTETQDGYTELIDGEIVVSGGALIPHQNFVKNLATWFTLLERQFPDRGTAYLAPLNVTLDEANSPEPDLFWVSKPESRCRVDEEGLRLFGAPDLIVEVVSPSSVRRDRVDKFRLYERHGVREYWLVEPGELFVEVFVHHDGRYALLGIFTEQDTFTSPVLGVEVKLSDVMGQPA